MTVPLPPDRWAHVEQVFQGALELPPQERDGFLAEACGDDAELRREVESLLDASGSGATGRFSAVGAVANDLLGAAPGPAVGTRLAGCRLEEEVGRGGMGVVYRAIREGEGFEQTVAVKVLPGALYRPDAVRRFRTERRILAGLEHPNIARLLDGGANEEGVPFVVMEYVDGEAIDRYVNRTKASLEERIRLFLAVCGAVQYAHGSLVVHRDLKPSNILVTAEGVPKLLDFGIAKLLDPEEDQTAEPEGGLTRTRIMTPRWASPEQILGRRVGTGTDVFGLGMVLYLLLAGVHARGGDGTDEEAGPAAGGLSLNLTPEPPSVASGDRRLSGDLDTIALKALQPRVEDRYETVGALAEDLERYLVGRPIAARPPSLLYRARKFAGRNRVGLGVGLAAVGLFSAQTFLFLGRLAEERDVARDEADRARRTLEFVTDVFRGADPFASSANDLTALELLSQGTARVERELADEPVVQGAILNTVGAVYENMGALDSAKAVFERSLAVSETAFGPDAPETALALSELGGVLIYLGEFERADTLLTASLGIRRARLPANHPDIAVDLGQRAFLKQGQGEWQVADSLFSSALQVMADPLEPRESMHATLLSNHGLLLLELDRLAEADETLSEALAMRRGLFGERHPEVAVTLAHLARVREAAGDYEAAETALREMLSWAPDALGPDHSFLTGWRNNLAAVLKELGRNEEALVIQEEVVARRRSEFGPRHGEVAIALNNVANLYGNLGRLAEAEAALQEALDINREAFGDDHPSVATNLNNLATLLWRRGDFDRAAAQQEEVLRMDREQLGPTHEYVAMDLTAVGTYHLYAGQVDLAGPLLQEGLELIRSIRGEDNLTTATAAVAYADWLVVEGRGEEAVELARQALEVRMESLAEDDAAVGIARSTLGAALTVVGAPAARAELDRAGRILEAALPEADPARVRHAGRVRAFEASRVPGGQ